MKKLEKSEDTENICKLFEYETQRKDLEAKDKHDKRVHDTIKFCVMVAAFVATVAIVAIFCPESITEVVKQLIGILG